MDQPAFYPFRTSLELFLWPSKDGRLRQSTGNSNQEPGVGYAPQPNLFRLRYHAPHEPVLRKYATFFVLSAPHKELYRLVPYSWNIPFSLVELFDS